MVQGEVWQKQPVPLLEPVKESEQPVDPISAEHTEPAAP